MRALRFQRRDGGSTVLAGAMSVTATLLVMLLAWLSADPAAHERLHHDADKADHHCVVTEFAMGEAYYLAPLVVVVPVEEGFETVRHEAIEVPRQPVDYLLLPARGPPCEGSVA